MIYKKSEVDIVAIAFKIPPFNHADQVGLNALEEYLSGGKSSLFAQKTGSPIWESGRELDVKNYSLFERRCSS